MLGNGNLAFEYFRFLNPIEHARTFDAALKYKVEPYAVAADIYSNPSMLGRGGWTWYTGSSAWLYTAGLEYILGIKKVGEFIELSPCFSSDWENCTVLYKYQNARYTINYYNYAGKENGNLKIYFNNEEIKSNLIPLISEGEHKVDYLFSE